MLFAQVSRGFARSPALALALAPFAAAQTTFSIDSKGPTIALPDCGGGAPITEGDVLAPCTPGAMPGF